MGEEEEGRRDLFVRILILCFSFFRCFWWKRTWSVVCRYSRMKRWRSDERFPLKQRCRLVLISGLASFYQSNKLTLPVSYQSGSQTSSRCINETLNKNTTNKSFSDGVTTPKAKLPPPPPLYWRTPNYFYRLATNERKSTYKTNLKCCFTFGT